MQNMRKLSLFVAVCFYARGRAQLMQMLKLLRLLCIYKRILITFETALVVALQRKRRKNLQYAAGPTQLLQVLEKIAQGKGKLPVLFNSESDVHEYRLYLVKSVFCNILYFCR